MLGAFFRPIRLANDREKLCCDGFRLGMLNGVSTEEIDIRVLRLNSDALGLTLRPIFSKSDSFGFVVVPDLPRSNLSFALPSL